MALARRTGGRIEPNTWPGFVDAMTALLLILMFVLSIFMIIQFVMRETITGQSKELNDLNQQLAGLADVLALERNRAASLESEVGELQASLAGKSSEVDRLNAAMAALIKSRDTAVARASELRSSLAESVSQREALSAALASARSEVDAAAEQARLAAAKREAMQALIADLKKKEEGQASELASQTAAREAAEQRLSEVEQAKLLEAAAAEALRERLQNSQAELDAMTLSLEKARKQAEDTLTLLAAAEAAKKDLEGKVTEGGDAFDREAALRKVAESKLATAEAQTAEQQRQVALLNAQVRALREQLGGLQALLDESEARDADSKIQIAKLGERLNQALAQKVGELAKFRSVFFEKMDKVLGGRQGIKRVGDRFVFQSEVLFAPGSATLDPQGQAELTKLGEVLREVVAEMPKDLNWILRVDGHTDKTPLGGGGRYRDNWELSQGRALSVVRYLIENERIPPDRLAAAGFGEYQPIDPGDSPEALARNRRIEFKFTER